MPLETISPMMFVWLIPLIVWSIIWKGYALWKCGRNNQPAWFIVILILNTAGILPIVYLVWFQHRKVRKIDVQRKNR
ncbi:hypothetical protein COV18_06260 [Candidatus Woesearchaeota archaeon CG10_big_fil_rev_8_21_14_0_10_37_12]|nr:MAG: hypothetical protein COV18_06260 [Candidatus Woesearchaeota archaeon CG10_big_fil_rev_8_21_14_0_10_37_12]